MPQGLAGCSSWAACYVAPFLGTMAGAYVRTPEVMIWGIAAIILGLAVRRLRTAAMGGLIIGCLALATVYAVSTTPDAAARALSVLSGPVVIGAAVIALAARAIGALVSGAFRRPVRTPVGPAPKG